MQETNIIQWLVLALIQGITEYLPISSSAHLILVSKIMNWQDQGLVMDIAAHGGSLIAVLWYFKEELKKLLLGNNWPLFNKLLLASIPLACVGFLMKDFIENNLRTNAMIFAVSSIVFGLLLYLSDAVQQKTNKGQKPKKVNTKQALYIGVAQVFALIPGASRSGVTMSAAMLMGFSRTKAASFSFLLAIPALLMTTAYGFLKLISEPTEYSLMGVMVVFSVSFLTSLLSIRLFLKLIEKTPISVFVWYRILLAILIIWNTY
jgi:undecaprenyl-diphosphatase